MPSLTHQEARSRAALLDVDRYEVHLDLTGLLDGETFRSTATIRFSCREPGATTFVDLATTELVSAELNGVEVDLAGWDGDRLTLPALAERNVLTVSARSDRSAGFEGLHRSVDASDGQVYVWTDYEPDVAHHVFACFDQPDLKARFAYTVTAPADWEVFSNSPAMSVFDRQGPRDPARAPGVRVWTFVDTPRLASYVTTICAGPLRVLRREVDGYELVLAARRSLAVQLEEQADELFSLTAAGLEFFGRQFAMPFPQPRYAQVFCPDMQGAMENYGCVTWTDAMVFRSEPTASERMLRAVILMHEMAHMWFGDIVTMRWWEDIWLNESFAEWAAVWAVAGASPLTSAWAWFATGRKESGYLADRAPTTHPIRQPVPDVAAAKAAFDMVTYAKGASVLRQLVAWAGEDDFVAGLRNYFTRHAWSNAGLDDLLSAVANSSGRDVAGWAQRWLLASGTNTLSLQADVTAEGAGEGGRYAQVRVLQTAPQEHPTLRPHRIRVGGYDLVDGALQPGVRPELDVDGPVTEVPELAEQRAADLLLLNDADLTFARLRLDPRSERTLLEHGHTLPDPLSRALAHTYLWHLVDDGLRPAADFVELAVRALGAETEPVLIDTLLESSVGAVQHWADPATGRRLRTRLAQACLDVLDRAPAGSRHGLLRSAAAVAHEPDQLAALQALADDDADLAWQLLIARAAQGDTDQQAVDELLRRDTDPDAVYRAAAVRAARPDPDAKLEIWRDLFERRTIPQGAHRGISLALYQPDQDEALEPLAERFLAELKVRGNDGMVSALSFVACFFPLHGVAGDFPARTEAAARETGVAPVVTRAVIERSDVLSRMLRARGLTAAPVAAANR